MKTTNIYFILSFILVFAFFHSVNGQSKFEIPELTKVGEGAYLKGELIYPLDKKPTPECHASTIVEVEDGLIAAWFGGTGEKHDDVGIWVSMNIDRSWSKPVEVADGYQNDKLRYPCWNPVLFQAKNGPLMLFYKVGPNPRDWWGMLTTSEIYSYKQGPKLKQHASFATTLKHYINEIEIVKYITKDRSR